MISVIIPTYNTALLIERTLRSVLAQTEQDFEIVVVDDGSTDDTVKCVENIADQRIRIFKQPENRGPAAARNRGLKEAKGEFCAFLDGDDYWEPEFLAETSKFLSAHPECIAVFTGQCHNSISAKASIRPRCLTDKSKQYTGAFIPDDFFNFWREQQYLICTGSILMRTQEVFQLGGQREDLRICEDLELWCLLGLHGKIGFIPKVLFTSDGCHGGKKGYNVWKKQIARWKSAPLIENWCKRHQEKTSNSIPVSYFFVKGEVSGILIYAAIMRGDFRQARKDVQVSSAWLPVCSMVRLYQFAVKSVFLWYPLCFLLCFRARIQKYFR